MAISLFLFSGHTEDARHFTPFCHTILLRYFSPVYYVRLFRAPLMITDASLSLLIYIEEMMLPPQFSSLHFAAGALHIFR